MPPPSGVKLRDSCQACATAKVRCSKDKPTCVRCADRNTNCQYLVTQRTGRKFRKRTDTDPPLMSNKDIGLMDISQLATTSAAPIGVAIPAASTISSPGMGPTNVVNPGRESGFLDLFSFDSNSSGLDLLHSISDPSAFPMPGPTAITPPLGHDVHRQPSSLVSDYLCDDAIPINPLTSIEGGEASPDSLDLGLSDFSNSSAFTQASSVLGDGTGFEHGTGADVSQKSQTEGLETALFIMSQLSCQDSSLSAAAAINATTTTAQGQNNGQNFQLLQAVIERNRETLTTVGNMLCSTACSQDGYALIIISLVVSQILRGYAAASQAASAAVSNDVTRRRGGRSSTVSSTSSNGDQRPEDELDPKSAQMVLNELFQVEKLIDQLGSKIQACKKGSWAVFGNKMTAAGFPFSEVVLNQLDTELRTQLSKLSLELVDRLRQYWG